MGSRNKGLRRCLSVLLAGLMAVGCMPLTVFAADGTAAASGEIALTEENFPDEAFRTYLQENADTDGDGALSETECGDVTDLPLSGMEIADLTGIGNFTKLTALDCSDNQLTTLDLSDAAMLAKLDCSGNGTLESLTLPEPMQLGGISMPGSMLTVLDCSDCALSSLSLDNCIVLGELNCSGNQLETLDLSGNTTLIRLDCSGNALTALDVAANGNLVELNCADNQLTDLSCFNYQNLTDLDCSGNQLTTLSVTGNSVLETLNCANNQLTTLSLSGDTSLVELDCSQNELTALAMIDLSLLEKVNCSGNQLTELDTRYCQGLKELNCADNRLDTLSLIWEKSLVILDCSGNLLKSLRLTGNPALETLNCSGNQLTALSVSSNTALTGLNCAKNQITQLDLSKNTSLASLDCSGNQLTTLSVTGNPALTALNCAENQLTALDITGLSLTSLDASGNSRTIVPQPERAGAYTYDLTQLPELDTSRVTGWENAEVKDTAPDTLHIAAGKSQVQYGYQLDAAQAVPVATFTLTLQPETDRYLELSEENFPDAALRSLLSGMDTDGNGWFSLEELEQITALTIPADSGVADLNGLEKLDWLETLNCDGLPLETLDVSGLSALRELSCNGCGLTELVLPKASVLAKLSCRENKLTALSLSGQNSLESLDCRNNQLSSLDTGETKLTADQLLADGNRVSIDADVLGQFDLSTLPGGFVPEQIVPDSLTNGTLSGTTLTVTEPGKDVTYQYYTDPAKAIAVTFTLLTEETLLPIDAAHFPDSDFRSYVQTLDADGDGYFSRAELDDVTQMDISQRSIWKLDGIRYFTKLESLDCSQNSLRELDLTGLTQLKSLDCSQNNLSKLTLPAAKGLEELYSSYNSTLQEFQVSDFPALRILNCAQCRIKELDLTGSPELETLNCTMNQLTVLNITGCTKLVSLNCSMNQLTALDLTGFSAINTLNCASNKLTQLDVSKCAELVSLNCSSNQLTVLPVSGLEKLETLLCIGNQLTSLQVSDQVTLKKLSATWNRYTVQLDSLNRFYLSDLPGDFQISRVDADSWTNVVTDGDAVYAADPSQNITYTYYPTSNKDQKVTFTLLLKTSEETETGIPIDAAHFPDEVFRAFVRQYDQNQDELLSAEEIAAVTAMDASGKGIADMTGVEYFTALETLSCGDNPALKRLSVISLSQLKTLRCANAALTALFLPRSSSLETLDCSKNQLTALNLNGCEMLNSLNCAENQLPELSLSGLSALQELDCHGNQLTSLDLSGRQLTRLDCSQNQLTSLDVSKQLSLEELSCGENQLIALDVTGLSQLQTLSADGNRRNVPVNAVCQLDLTTLADGFAPEFAAEDSWQNAVCDGTLLTVTDISAEVQYDYCIDANDLERTVRFTLVPQAMEEDSIAIDAEHFPDDAFRVYVMEKLDRNQDGMLQKSEQEIVTELDISGCGIADLTGIENFSNLKKLNCAENRITDLSPLPDTLTSLDCSKNAMTELDVSRFTSLTELRCRGLHLEQLDVTALSALKLLDCGDNALSGLALRNETLEELYCDSNQLTKLDTRRCTVLQKLYCQKNELTSISLGSTNLTVLSCADNQLESLELADQTSMEELDCSGNQISALILSTLKKLNVLNAGHNPLLSLYLSEEAPMTSCDLTGCRTLKTPQYSGRQLYLEPTLWSRFLMERASDWSNAQVDGAKVVADDPLNDITYVYDTGNPNVKAVLSVGLQAIPLNAAEVTLADTERIYYTGEELTPKVLVKVGDHLLREGTDYLLSYENNVNAGRGTIRIAPVPDTNWSGSNSLEFVIEKGVPKVSVVWDDSVSYTEGDAVPPIRLDSANTPGVLTWAADTSDTLKSGENRLQWRFVPADSENYETVLGTVTITAKEKPVTTTTTSVTTTTTTTTTTAAETTTTTTAPATTTTAPATTSTTTTETTTTTSTSAETTTSTTTTTTTEPFTTTSRGTYTKQTRPTTTETTTTTSATTQSYTKVTKPTTTTETTTVTETTTTTTTTTVTTTTETTTSETTTSTTVTTTTTDTTETTTNTSSTTETTGSTTLTVSWTETSTTTSASATTSSSTTTTTAQTTTVTTTSATTTTKQTQQLPRVRGDANMDGRVDSQDMFELMLYIARRAVGEKDVVFNDNPNVNRWLILLMDINNDSVLDTQDLFYLMLYIAMHGVGMDVSWSDVLKN